MRDSLSSNLKTELLFWFFSLCLGLSFGILLQEYGLVVASDSIPWLDAALVFLEPNISISPKEAPFFPFVLSIVSLFMLPAEAACFVNGLSGALLVTSAIRIAYRLQIPWYGLVLIGLIPIMWTDMWHVHQGVWPEASFLALISLHFVYLQEYLHKPTAKNWFVAIAFAALALSTQYIGYCLLPHLFFLLWLYRKKVDTPSHILLSFIASSPHVLWILYNYFRAETMFGKYTASPYSVADNIEHLLRISMESFGAGLGVIIFAVVAGFIWQNPIQKLKQNPPKALFFYSIASSLLFFTTALVLSRSSVMLGQIDSRFAAPIYTLVYLLSIFGTSHLWLLIRKHQNFTTITALGVVIFTIALGKQVGIPDRDSLKWINQLENQKQEALLPHFGINKSSTVISIQKTLFDEIKGKDHINLLWLEEQSYNSYFKLLLHRNVLHSNHLRIEKVHSQIGRIQAALRTPHGLILLSVHNAGAIENRSALQSRIETLFKTTNDKRLILVAKQATVIALHAKDLSWETNIHSDSIRIDCLPIHDPKPYLIFNCQQKQQTLPTHSESNKEYSSFGDLQLKEDIDTAPISAQALEISELMVSPLRANENIGEWIELYNRSPKPLSLQGLEIHSKGDSGFQIYQDLIIPPEGQVLLAAHADPEQNGGLPQPDYTYEQESLHLTTDDWIELRYNDQRIDRVEFTEEMIERGASLMKDDGRFCVAISKYGSGDRGSPGSANHCLR